MRHSRHSLARVAALLAVVTALSGCMSSSTPGSVFDVLANDGGGLENAWGLFVAVPAGFAGGLVYATVEPGPDLWNAVLGGLGTGLVTLVLIAIMYGIAELVG